MNKIIHIILTLTLKRDFSTDEKRTFLVEIKAYIEISYYKFNVISAFQKYRVLCYAPTFISLVAHVYALSRAFRSSRRSVRRGKEEKTESKNYPSNTV